MAQQQADNNRAEHEETASLPVAANEPARPRDDEMSRALATFWEAVKRLPAYLRLAAAMARDPAVPKQAKAVLGVGGGYAISPIDFVPGVIPIAGQLDDLYVILTALQQAVRLTPAPVAERHLAAVGLRREDIDDDLRAVRELVRVAVVKSVKFGGKTLGRLSRAATDFASRQIKRRGVQRTEEPL